MSVPKTETERHIRRERERVSEQSESSLHHPTKNTRALSACVAAVMHARRVRCVLVACVVAVAVCVFVNI